MYKLILATRYFLQRPIAYLAASAIALCVFTVVVVMTVMNGLVVEFRDKNHRFTGDCVISSPSLVGFPYYDEFIRCLEGHPFIAAVSPVIKSYGLLTRPGADWNKGIEIAGIDPVRHCRATGFGDTVYYHARDRQNIFVPQYAPALAGCVFGIDLVNPGRQDRSGQYVHSASAPKLEVVISCFPLTVKGALEKAGTDLLNSKSFFYSDDSHSGLVKADGQVVYLPFEAAQALCGMNNAPARTSSIHIKFADGVDINDGARKVEKLWQDFVAEKKDTAHSHLLGQVRVQNWLDYRRSSIAPMEKEQAMMILLFLMLAVITVFVIFVVMYMIVSHKSRDIGILKSLGVGNIGLLEIFLNFAILTGITGATAGTVLGCVFLARINAIEGWLYAKYGWQLWNRSVYAIGLIPSDIDFGVVSLIFCCAVGVSLAGALVPALTAAMRRPAEVLQVSQL